MTKVAQPSMTLDLDTRDLTLALDGVAEDVKKRKTMFVYGTPCAEPKKVKGLKLAIAEHVTAEEIIVPVRHPVFNNAKTKLPIMSGLQLPIHIYTRPMASSTTASPSMKLLSPSVRIGLLCMDTDVHSDTFGTAPTTLPDKRQTLSLAQKSSDFTQQHLVKLLDHLGKNIELPMQSITDRPGEERAKARGDLMMKWKGVICDVEV